MMGDQHTSNYTKQNVMVIVIFVVPANNGKYGQFIKENTCCARCYKIRAKEWRKTPRGFITSLIGNARL